MKERPILFSAPMVRALLAGTKTQTRRVVKPQPAPNRPHDGGTRWAYDIHKDGLHVPVGSVGHLSVKEKTGLKCPGQPGDRLWVRETFQYRGASYGGEGLEDSEWFRCYGKGGAPDNWDPRYPAGWKPSRHMSVRAMTEPADQEDGVTSWITKKIPSIHMPRWASRITLEVISVRVERLNDISESDCWAEGIEEVMHDFDDAAQIDMANRLGCCIEDAKPLYALLWEQINGKGSWDANPWVWVIDFRRAAQEGGAA